MIANRITRIRVGALGAILIASVTAVSAHVVRGRISPAITAFVSSPTPGGDLPVALRWSSGELVEDTGLRVACFNVANTSARRVDRPDWPRITSVGFELPGSRSGFSLVAPLDGDWEIVEGTRAFVPDHRPIMLDFAIVARANPAPRRPVEPRGIPPGQQALRGKGTRFCVSGPFPDKLPNLETPDPKDTLDASIERLINGVVVEFHGVYENRGGFDVGLWDSPLRLVPLYPPVPE